MSRPPLLVRQLARAGFAVERTPDGHLLVSDRQGPVIRLRNKTERDPARLRTVRMLLETGPRS